MFTKRYGVQIYTACTKGARAHTRVRVRRERERERELGLLSRAALFMHKS